jgi:hypothetical protein
MAAACREGIMPIRTDKRTLLLIIVILSILASIVIIIANLDTGRKLTYYRSPKGVLERALNRSAEKDYNDTLAIHNARFYVGLILLLIGLGGIGLYMRTSRIASGEVV